MACPKQGELIRALAGELPAGRRAAVERHLADCAPCRLAWDELRDTWTTLGSWSLDTPEVDLTDRVLAGATAAPSTEDTRRRLQSVPAWLRVAASIALATGLGVATGRFVPVPTEQPAQVAQPAMEDVVDSLGLEHLAIDSATGLVTALTTPEAVVEDKP